MTIARHTPDEELHAYLDQALSRSQAAEIERHLARCPRCQEARDDIARLRDRTTELLAVFGPPSVIPPAFATLQARAAERSDRRSRWLVSGAWAASIAVAVLAGWTLRSAGTPKADPDATMSNAAPVVAAPAPERATEPQVRPVRPAPRAEPGRLVRAPVQAREQQTQVQFAAAVETAPPEFYPATARQLNLSSAGSELTDFSSQPMGVDPGLKGLWRTVSPDSAGQLRSVDVPLVPGLPVVQVRVQPGETGPDVTAVDQMLESGELVRTLAGPAPRVAALVAAEEGQPQSSSPADGTNRVTVTIQQGDRMVAVTGPSQALGSLLNRVTPRRRY